jgi:hypothetical protein
MEFTLSKIILVRDHNIYLILLKFLPRYLGLIPKDLLEETFLPQMLLGLQARAYIKGYSWNP